MTTKAPKEDRSGSQKERFIETARAIGCDEDEGAFKERLGKLLSAPVPPRISEANAPKGKAKRSKEGH